MKPLLLMMCLGSVAVAQPSGGTKPPTKITGDTAKVLVRALKLAAVKSTKLKSKTTWAAKLLSCTTTKPDDVVTLEVTECHADGAKITGAAAVVLEAGMNKAGIPAPYMMGKTEIQASSLSCYMDEAAHDEDGPFVCTYTPVGRL